MTNQLLLCHSRTQLYIHCIIQTHRKKSYLPLRSQTTVGLYHCAVGLFEEYHSSSAALGKQRLGVTKQPPFGDWGGQQQHPNVADV